jgi:hypothetical protein
MSRRIAYVFAIAACAALTAGPSAADRECFDNACRMPTVLEPPAEPTELPADANEQPNTVDVVPPTMDAQRAQAPAPVRIGPRMMVDPVQRQTLDPAPRHRFEAAPLQPTRQVSRYSDEPQETVQVANPGPYQARAEQSSTYVASKSARSPHGGVVVVAASPYPEDGMMPAYPYMRPDPAWRLCQIGAGGGDQRYHCGPYSYHPYGVYGQRPYGTYRPYLSAPVYVQAPSARIITLDPDD